MSISECCGYEMNGEMVDAGICPCCHEHCEVEQEEVTLEAINGWASNALDACIAELNGIKVVEEKYGCLWFKDGEELKIVDNYFIDFGAIMRLVGCMTQDEQKKMVEVVGKLSSVHHLSAGARNWAVAYIYVKENGSNRDGE